MASVFLEHSPPAIHTLLDTFPSFLGSGWKESSSQCEYKVDGFKIVQTFVGFLHRHNHTQPSIAFAVSESKSLSKTDFLPESSRDDIMQAFLDVSPSPRPSLSGINFCIKIHH
jgi:hypothetical protein